MRPLITFINYIHGGTTGAPVGYHFFNFIYTVQEGMGRAENACIN